MSGKGNRSAHKFPAPWRHHEPTEDDFDEALRIFQMDGQLENNDRIDPHEFSDQQRQAIVKVLPENASESTIEKFLLHLAFAIGSYKHWQERPMPRTSFNKFYRELAKIRNYSQKLSRTLAALPPQFRERMDVGVCLRMLREPNFAKFPGQPRYWSADWSSSFVVELAALNSVAEEVEAHFKEKNRGGAGTDGQMTLLARETLAAYASCFDEIPPVTDSHPFARTLDIVTKIVGRHGADYFSVMHYVDKAIGEARPDSQPDSDDQR